ncbi:MAG: hypothetical protein FWD57_00720 [Polyangiaceae bacterium]|nr:hypothetical protein [Polyangiaceae bacterium]
MQPMRPVLPVQPDHAEQLKNRQSAGPAPRASYIPFFQPAPQPRLSTPQPEQPTAPPEIAPFRPLSQAPRPLSYAPPQREPTPEPFPILSTATANYSPIFTPQRNDERPLFSPPKEPQNLEDQIDHEDPIAPNNLKDTTNNAQTLFSPTHQNVSVPQQPPPEDTAPDKLPTTPHYSAPPAPEPEHRPAEPVLFTAPVSPFGEPDASTETSATLESDRQQLAPSPPEEPNPQPTEPQYQPPLFEEHAYPGADTKQQTPIAKAEQHWEDEPKYSDHASDNNFCSADYDRLHDDFFRDGENVEMTNMALTVAEPSLQNKTNPHYQTKPTNAKHAERRRRNTRVAAALILVPAILIAVFAAYNALSYQGVPAGSASAPGHKHTASTNAPNKAAGAITVSVPISEPNPTHDQHVNTNVGDAPGPTDDPQPTDAPTAAPPAPEDPPTRAAHPVDASVDLRKEANKALNQGKWKKAEELATQAIEQYPEDANPYLYKAGALQSLGRYKDAKEVFKECARVAKKGPVHECRYLAQ